MRNSKKRFCMQSMKQEKLRKIRLENILKIILLLMKIKVTGDGLISVQM